ncbi:hypothetical protein AVEN_81470-1 [Araneus ventricosus]|uniref:Uncharacterized protein n=1 Tax=Araneus ventricosus TaxID=182803 RepID=A0A4Y2E331_ARAVE|nr:hypothetical protein AVEN_81470-1 [Araneus ventricosus]
MKCKRKSRTSLAHICNRHEQQSGTETGILIAIAGHVSTIPAGGTSRHRSEGNSTPHQYYTHWVSENLFIYPEPSGPRSRVAATPGGRKNSAEWHLKKIL